MVNKVRERDRANVVVLVQGRVHFRGRDRGLNAGSAVSDSR
jgi:hypothetical protein